jgi:hypothetical protein
MPPNKAGRKLGRESSQLKRNSAKAQLDYLDFIAVCDGDGARIWAVQEHELGVLLDILASPELTTELICDLHDGRSVPFPDDDSAIHLVLPGSPVPHKKVLQRVSISSTSALARRKRIL